jgi:protein phosphatase
MRIELPSPCLVLLVGAPGYGKSTFARRHFLPTEIVSSDACRVLVSDSDSNRGASADAFQVLDTIIAKRLAGGRLTVVDATNAHRGARQRWLRIAERYHVLPIAIVFDFLPDHCRQRNRERERRLPEDVVDVQLDRVRHSLDSIEDEEIAMVHVLRSEHEAGEVTFDRMLLPVDRGYDSGPFDIVGDVHGCFDELVELLVRLGYRIERLPVNRVPGMDEPPTYFRVNAPTGRRALFLGDLVDRGPNSPDVLKLAMSMVQTGAALCVPGNHDHKLMRKLLGRNVQIRHGLEKTLAQMERESASFHRHALEFITGLVSHYVLDGGRLVVAHAGLRRDLQGRVSPRVLDFALYGETTGEVDDMGLPIRIDWAAEYRGRAKVVYGHTPVPEPRWINNTINIDTGCVFGGSLTALRYPELELVAVPARERYAQSSRPIRHPSAEAL